MHHGNIYTDIKFHEIQLIGYLVMVQYVDFNQYKGTNSCTTEAILTKLDMHQRILVICYHIKFHKIPLNGYLVMA